METRKLGKTGLEVSILGFGGGPVGFLATDRDEVGQVLNSLLDNGVNLIDTAAAYHGSEEAIGATVSHRRDDYVLVSKCGREVEGCDAPAWSAETVTFTVDRALRRLKTDRLDVMLLHSCDLETLQKGEALGALVKAREAGKIRFAGYSGDNEAAVWAARQADVAVIETSISICDQVNIDSLLPLARQNDIGVLVKRPIANTAWLGKGGQPGFYATYAEPYVARFAAMGIGPADLGFDGEDKALWPEIALRFTLWQPGVTTAIVGTTRPANVARNLEAVAKGPLPQDVVSKLREAFKRGEAAAGESWPGLT